MNVTDITDHMKDLLGAGANAAAANAPVAAAAAGLVAVSAAMGLLIRKLIRAKAKEEEDGTVLCSIHYYAGSAPNSDHNKLCMELLRGNPKLVNKPMHEEVYVSHGYTPFLRACWNNNYDLIHFMLKIGANLSITNADGEGPLYLVAYRVSKSTKWDARSLNVLWNAGCSVDEVNVHNNSMLHLAAKAGNVTLARWLLLHGAEISITNSAGHTPRSLALKKGSPAHMVVANLLRRPSPDGVRRRFVRRVEGIDMMLQRSDSSPPDGHLAQDFMSATQ